MNGLERYTLALRAMPSLLVEERGTAEYPIHAVMATTLARDVRRQAESGLASDPTYRESRAYLAAFDAAERVIERYSRSHLRGV